MKRGEFLLLQVTKYHVSVLNRADELGYEVDDFGKPIGNERG